MVYSKILELNHLNELIKIGFDGYAIGGLAVGETQNEMFNVLDDIKEHIMPDDKPQIFNGCRNTYRYSWCC